MNPTRGNINVDVLRLAMGASRREAAAPLGDGTVRRQPNILARLSEAERRTFLAACREQILGPGERIFDQGTTPAGAYVMLSGLARTYYVSSIGREITLAFWSEGDWIGAPDFFATDSHHIWSAEAVEASTMLVMPAARLKELTAEIPAIAMAVITALSFKLNWVSLLLQTLGTESVSERLARLLLTLGEVHGQSSDKGIVIRYPFSQQDLAAMVGASRQWVSMALARLQRKGIICHHGRQLIIVDHHRLMTEF